MEKNQKQNKELEEFRKTIQQDIKTGLWDQLHGTKLLKEQQQDKK